MQFSLTLASGNFATWQHSAPQFLITFNFNGDPRRLMYCRSDPPVTRSVMKTTSSFCLLIQAFMNVMIRWWSRLLGFIQCLTFRTAVQDSENCGCLTWNITLVGSKMHFSVDGPRKKFERAYLGYLSYILEFRREPLPVRNSTRCLHLGTEN